MMFKKNRTRPSQQRRQLVDDMENDLSHSPLYLSEYEKAQLLGCYSRARAYEGITPVPVPAEFENCVWYQGWHDIWKCHYYHNVETKQSQWEEPKGENIVPFGSTNGGEMKSLPHQSKLNLGPQGITLSRPKNCARHSTKEERKERHIKSLIEATGCNRKEAKRALKAAKKDLDLAASLILKSRKTSNAQDLTKNSHPDQLYCSICLDVMKDAVCCSDGHSYCNVCICNWLKQNKSSPMTNEQLAHTELIPNHALRSLISSIDKR
jgi:hypothetical protein